MIWNFLYFYKFNRASKMTWFPSNISLKNRASQVAILRRSVALSINQQIVALLYLASPNTIY